MQHSISVLFKTLIRTSVQGAGVAALITIAYTMWSDSKAESASNAETRALLAITTKQFEESKVENLKLKEEKKQSQSTADNLYQQVLTEQADSKYTKRLLDEANTKIKALDIQLEQLVRLAKSNDPCADVKLQISEIEKLLRRPSYDAFAPQGKQRDQLAVTLTEKNNTLNICLGARG